MFNSPDIVIKLVQVLIFGRLCILGNKFLGNKRLFCTADKKVASSGEKNNLGIYVVFYLTFSGNSYHPVLIYKAHHFENKQAV